MEKTQLRDLILKDPSRALREMGKADLFLIAREVSPTEGASFQIDLLALDTAGQTVVILMADSIDAGDAEGFLGRALMAASLIEPWEAEKLLDYLSEDEAEQLGLFLEAEVPEINQKQRVLLVAGTYHPEMLSAVEWLRKRYGLDITCLEVGVATDPNTHAAYLLSSEV